MTAVRFTIRTAAALSGETQENRTYEVILIDILEDRFAPDPNVYVSGNLLVFYE